MTLTKQRSDLIKGFAVLFMLFHHLFAFPDLIPQGLSIHPLFSNIPLEYKLGTYGKVCVSMFLFLSGYSFGLKIVSTALIPTSILRRLTRFFCVYWVNFALFVPIGILYFSHLPGLDGGKRFDPSWGNLLQNLLGIKATYVGEWWFVRLYLILTVIGWPLLELLDRLHVRAVIAVSLILFGLSWYSRCLDHLWVYQSIFTSGFLLARYKVYEKWSLAWLTPQFRWPLISMGFSVLSIAFVAVIRSRFGGFAYDLLWVPLLIPMLVGLSSLFHLDRYMELLGRYSAHMWLNHALFCHYFYGYYFYVLHYPPLIFTALVLVSLGVAIVTDWLTKPLLRALDRAEFHFRPLPKPLAATVQEQRVD